MKQNAEQDIQTALRRFFEFSAEHGKSPTLYEWRDMCLDLEFRIKKKFVKHLTERGFIDILYPIRRGMYLTDLAREVVGCPRREITFTIGMIPTVNHTHLPNGRGGRYKSPEAITYFAQAQYAARHAMTGLAEDRLFAGQLEARIVNCMSRIDWDAHNRHKLLLDALQGVVYADDSQIERLIIDRDWADEPKSIVTVREVFIPRTWAETGDDDAI